jgi:oligoribonuclease NrnB/cAMP/cGMP phosphodiesterase (DHH superfamily)
MTTVIYHSADYDGIFCREIAKHFLGTEGVEYIGWNFGDPLIPIPEGDGQIYILDLSPDCLEDGSMSGVHGTRVIWIDHHKTSIEKWGTSLPGYRIDGVAACRLAWQWFSINQHNAQNQTNEALQVSLSGKQDFIDRKVSEPLAVRLAGEYDIWDHRGDGDLEFQFGLRCQDATYDFWQLLLDFDDNCELIISAGRVAMAYSKKVDADLVTYKSFRLKWEGLDFLCLNHGRFNSLTFAALDKPETGHDALLGFMWNGKVWTYSLYHAAHRKDLDLSEIAKKHGGGGHRGACGFTSTTQILPL